MNIIINIIIIIFFVYIIYFINLKNMTCHKESSIDDIDEFFIFKAISNWLSNY